MQKSVDIYAHVSLTTHSWFSCAPQGNELQLVLESCINFPHMHLQDFQ